MGQDDTGGPDGSLLVWANELWCVCSEWLIRSTEDWKEDCNTWNTNYQLKCQRNPPMKVPMFTMYTYTLPLRSRSSEKNTVCQLKEMTQWDRSAQHCLSLSRILIYVCDHLSWFILFLGYFIFISVNNDDLKWQLLLECNSNPQYPE